jgi:hypothetical protein
MVEIEERCALISQCAPSGLNFGDKKPCARLNLLEILREPVNY